jgi:serine-threonine kinase receptor-associated protein
VWSAAINDEATLAVTGSADFTVRLWSALSGDEKREELTLPHVVKTVAFSPGPGRLFLAGSHDKVVRVFDTERAAQGGAVEPRALTGLGGHPKVARFLHGDDIIVGGGAGKHLRVWDLRSASDAPAQSVDLGSPLTSLELSPAGDVLTATHGRTVSFLDPRTFATLASHDLPYTVDGASLHPSKTRFVAGGHDNKVHVYAYGSGEEIEVHQAHHGPVHAVAYVAGWLLFCLFFFFFFIFFFFFLLTENDKLFQKKTQPQLRPGRWGVVRLGVRRRHGADLAHRGQARGLRQAGTAKGRAVVKMNRAHSMPPFFFFFPFFLFLKK